MQPGHMDFVFLWSIEKFFSRNHRIKNKLRQFFVQSLKIILDEKYLLLFTKIEFIIKVNSLALIVCREYGFQHCEFQLS